MQILTKDEFSQQALLVVTRAIRQDFTKIRLREPSCSTRTERDERTDVTNQTRYWETQLYFRLEYLIYPPVYCSIS
jgi:hypothetical protein